MMLLSEFEHELLSRPAGTPAAKCVEAIVDRLLSALEITEGPVDLAMAASMVDITMITVVDDLPAAGCLVTPPGERSQIRVNAADGRTRQRFSIGHEITHTFFPGYSMEPQYRCAPSAAPARVEELDVEALCDIGAANLILPRKLLLPRLATAPLALELVEDIANEFDASLLATAHRLAALSATSAAVVVLEPANKPSERGSGAAPKLRVQTAKSHGPGWPYIPRHKSTAPGDPFDRALDGEIVNESQIEVKGVTAMPVICNIQARLYPYRRGGVEIPRVIALLTR